MTDRELPLLYNLFGERLHQLLASWGVSPEHIAWLGLLTGFALVALVMLLLAHVLTRVLNELLRRVSVTTISQFDDHLLKENVPRYVARIIPLTLAYNLIPSVLVDFPRWVPYMERLFNVFFIVLALRITRSVLHAGRNTLQALDNFRGKPLGSYTQVVTLVLYIIGGLAILSQLTGVSVLAFLTTMGAASAVMLLVFKDTIMGFVASIQISLNDMVRIDDWIEMPKYGADGDVIEINLTTVKVRNWDKTVTTVPTYALIGDSFKNYRSMFDGGGRRIKRAIRVKISTIRHLTQEELNELRRIQLLAPYIDERRAEIKRYNTEHNVDKSVLVNGRELTNVGLYRKYIELYLAAHPGIHPGMTRMVRHLAPDQHGLPIELYCFTSDTRWGMFESVMADVFDHLLAVNSYFHLEVFESPAADDLRATARTIGEAART